MRSGAGIATRAAPSCRSDFCWRSIRGVTLTVVFNEDAAMKKFVIHDKFGEPLKSVPLDEQRGLVGANLDGMVAPGVQLQGQNLSDANLYGCFLAGADLSFALLVNADMRGANLNGASLRGANLGRNALGGAARLRGADLSSAILTGTRLDGAEYDDSTIFPAGFNPAACGMVTS